MPEIVTPTALLALTGLLAYLLGSVPFGIVITRALGLGDLRRIGSGNIGATNVLRTGHRSAALATLLLDAGKGAIAVLAARVLLAADAGQLAGAAAFIGHLFPVWLGFRGGKGVATFLGTLIALAWPVGLAACATWALSALLFRISSLAALCAAALAPVWSWLLGWAEGTALAAVLGFLVIVRHHQNIARIISGTEPRIGKGR